MRKHTLCCGVGYSGGVELGIPAEEVMGQTSSSLVVGLRLVPQLYCHTQLQMLMSLMKNREQKKFV